MEEVKYEIRTVIIQDAKAVEDLRNDKYIQTLWLLLKDEETGMVFQSELQESDVRKIIKSTTPLTTKQMVDLAISLRQREEPLKLMVPEASKDVNADDIIKSRSLDSKTNQNPKNNKRRPYYRKRKRNNSNNQNQRKNN